METGHDSSHARHVVHAHSASGFTTPPARGPASGPDARMASRRSRTTRFGERGLPAAWAGHTDSQRPHSVQASSMKSCVQRRSDGEEIPSRTSSAVKSVGAGTPRAGRGFEKKTLSGLVNTWTNFVNGSVARSACQSSRCVTQSQG